MAQQYTMRDLNGIQWVNTTPTPDQTQLYNTIGRNTGDQGGGLFDFFKRKGDSIGNAIGTTLAAPLSAAKVAEENRKTEDMQKQMYENRDNIVKKYGFANYDDFSNAQEQAEAEGNETKYDNIWNELSAQTAADAAKMKQSADEFKDWRENSFVGQKTNQDRGKFLGSAINTLSTGFDILAPGAGVLANGIQGGIEGIADELEDNGFQNFNAANAGVRAASGLASGLASGGLNKALSGKLAANNGNWLKGTNKLTGGLNTALNAANKYTLGASNGAIRGALSGAVGGGVGAGTSAALTGQDVLGNALAGAQAGAVGGAVAGGTMAVGNNLINRVPGVARANQAIQQAGDDFNAKKAELGTIGALKETWQESPTRAGLERAAEWVDKNMPLGNTIRPIDADQDIPSWIQDAYRAQSSKYNDPSKMEFMVTPEGNLSLYYAGKDTGTIVRNPSEYDLETLRTSGRIIQPTARAAEQQKIIDTMWESNPHPEYAGKEDYARALAEANPDMFATPAQDAYGQSDEASQLAKRLYDALDKADPYETGENLIEWAESNGIDTERSGWEKKAINGWVAETANSIRNKNDIMNANEWANMLDEYINQPSLDNDVNPITGGIVAQNELADLQNALRNYGNSQTPAQDAYEQGQGSFSDALNEFIAQGGNISRSTGEAINEMDNTRARRAYEEIGLEAPGRTVEQQKYDAQMPKGQVETIREVVADNGKTNKFTTVMRGVSEKVRNIIRAAAGIDVDGYSHVVDSSAVKHALNGHSSDSVPLTEKDIELIPDILKNADNVVYSGKNNKGLDTILYEKQYGDKIAYVEETRNGRHQLAMNTMYWAKKGNQKSAPTGESSALEATDSLRALPRPAGSANDTITQKLENVNPETEVYRTITGDQEPMKTSKEYDYRRKAAQALLAQYGIVDQPTSRATEPIKVVQQVADAGFTKPQEVESMIRKVTGTDGEVNKLTQKAILNAGKINTVDDFPDGTTFDDFVKATVEANGLGQAGKSQKADDVIAQVNRTMQMLSTRKNGSITGLDNAEDVFDVIRKLEAYSAEYKGKGGSTYHRATQDDISKAKVLDAITEVLEDKVWDATDVKKVVTPDTISSLKNLAPGNKKWAQYVDDTIGKAKTGKQLRTAQVPFVRMGKIIDNANAQSGTWGASTANFLSRAARNDKKGLAASLLGAAVDSPAAKRVAYEYNTRMADAEAAKAKTAPETQKTAPVSASEPQTVNSTTPTPETQIYNAIGRETGQQMGEAAAGYIQAAADQVETQLGNSYLPENAVYNAVGGASQVSTMPSQADIMKRAMDLAMEAGDANAWAQLYAMYNEAAGSSANELDTTQQTQLAKLETAGSAINQLEDLFAQAGGGQGVLVGNARKLLGSVGLDSNVSTYNQLSEGLVNQIAAAVGKTDSLNTEGEVKRALQLIPQITDDAQTANNKLEQLRAMLESTSTAYRSAYGI